MLDEKTEKVDSESTDKEVKTDVTADSSKAEDVKEKSSDSDQMPWHKDPRFKDDLKLLKLAKKAVEDNGVETFDDLVDLVKAGKKIHGKLKDDDDVDDIINRAEENRRHHKYWKQQEELTKQGMETPEQTIARLKSERDEVVNKVSLKEKAEKDSIESKKAIQFYETEISNQLDSIEDVTPDMKEVLSWSLGVGNECNEINLTDRKAIKKVTSDGIKKFNKFVKTVQEKAVKDYLSGKTSIPAVPSTDGTVATTKIEPPKGLKGMRQAFHELTRGSNGG